MFSIIVVWGRVEGREVNALNLLDQGHQGMKVCAGADLDDLEKTAAEMLTWALQKKRKTHQTWTSKDTLKKFFSY